MPTPRSTRPRPAWALREGSRSLVSSTIGALIGIGLLVLALSTSDVAPIGTVFAIITVWAVFSAVHTYLTWWTFHGLEGEDLRAAVAFDSERNRRQSRWRGWVDRFLLGNGGAASWSVQISGMAMFAVLVLVLTPGLRGYDLLLVAVLVMAAASWTNVAVTYAVHYARVDTAASDDAPLGFPGHQRRSFSDYLYFAGAVQTTFATTDVEVRTTAMRRIVTGHGALAFAFNSVIIAILVSLLLGAT